MTKQVQDKQRISDLEDLKTVLKSSEGRRLIWRMLEAAGVFRLSFQQNDPLSSAFNEGMRNMGILIMSDVLEVCPDRYLQMQREHQKRIEEMENVRPDE